MKFGVGFANIMGFSTPTGARAIGQGAEAAGFDSIWTVEHTIVPAGYQSEYPYDRSGKMPMPDDGPMPDPLVWLAFLAAATTTIELATGILILPQRNPLTAAKEIATLDALSEGRVRLGVGVGWMEEEFAALGVPFADRGKRLEAYIEAMRALWTGQAASVHNEFVSFDPVVCSPAPAAGTVPIVIGGHSKAAARRAGRLGDGFFPGKGSPAELRGLIEVMRSTAQEAGRDPDAIEVTVSRAVAPEAALALVEELEAMGVHRLVVPPPTGRTAQIADALGAFGEQVISQAS